MSTRDYNLYTSTQFKMSVVWKAGKDLALTHLKPKAMSLSEGCLIIPAFERSPVHLPFSASYLVAAASVPAITSAS